MTTPKALSKQCPVCGSPIDQNKRMCDPCARLLDRFAAAHHATTGEER